MLVISPGSPSAHGPRPRPRRGSLLVAGTTSDAGKTTIVTGLCRLLARHGVRVAPFKAQNMSNNSMVVPLAGLPTVDGEVTGSARRFGEIGRAQWVQALAAQVQPEVAMNPVLLKPGSDLTSHVIVNGLPAGRLGANEFAVDRTALRQAAFDAFDDLAARFDVVIAEGAGSPAEINLRANDFVNMGLAQHAKMPVIVVGDIDRGGVYAAFFGTLGLLDDADQALVKAFLINKFRGDESLLTPANDELLRRTGRPVVGVVPWQLDLWLDSEDTLDPDSRRREELADPLRVAVVRLPRISNLTDVDALAVEPDVDVRFGWRPADLHGADLIVVPGSRATLADLAWLRRQGLAQAIIDHARAGKAVLGICGGYQMLGDTIDDPSGVEGVSGSAATGLGLLPARTTFTAEKVLALPHGVALGAECGGYEIHHGVVDRTGGDEFLDGARSGQVFGTLWHGALEHDAFRTAFLTEVAHAAGRERAASGVEFHAARERRIDVVADLIETHCDVTALVKLATWSG